MEPLVNQWLGHRYGCLPVVLKFCIVIMVQQFHQLMSGHLTTLSSNEDLHCVQVRCISRHVSQFTIVIRGNAHFYSWLQLHGVLVVSATL